MNRLELDRILDTHKKWLQDDGGEKADLCGANLCEANLRRANLRGADLCGANLYEADLRGADLHLANLRGADLREADLSGTILRGADLREAGLSKANLRGADLRGADLSGADLDYSCFPLWCGGSKFGCDTKLVYQLLAHICTLEFNDSEGIKDLIKPFAAKSHRAEDLGIKEE